MYVCCSAERETTLVSADMSSFKSVEKDWQSQLVINFIDQVQYRSTVKIYSSNVYKTGLSRNILFCVLAFQALNCTAQIYVTSTQLAYIDK